MNTLDFSQDPNAVEADQIRQRIQLAQLISRQAIDGGPVYSGKAAAARALGGLVGGMEMGSAQADQRALAERGKAERNGQMQQIFDAMSSETPDRNKLAKLLMLSGNPEAAKAGMALLTKGPTKLDRQDLGDRVGLFDESGNLVREVSKGISPDTRYGKETIGAESRFNRETPSADNLINDKRAREEGAANRGVTVRGQNITDDRTRGEGQAGREVAIRGQDMADARAREAAGNKPLSESERVAGGYALRMQEAEKLFGGLKTADLKPGVREAMLTTGNSGAGEMLANSLPEIAGGRSDARQNALQAQRDWVRAKLRKESGAVIGEQEMENEIRTYFPQVGDSDGVVKQKTASRANALEAMRMGAGRAASAGNRGPKAGAVVDGFRFKGGDPNDQTNWEKV